MTWDKDILTCCFKRNYPSLKRELSVNLSLGRIFSQVIKVTQLHLLDLVLDKTTPLCSDFWGFLTISSYSLQAGHESEISGKWRRQIYWLFVPANPWQGGLRSL